MGIAREGVGESGKGLTGWGLLVRKHNSRKGAKAQREDSSRRDAEGAALAYDRIIGFSMARHA